MLIRDRNELTIRIDVLTKSGILYRGTVYEKRIGAAGELATLVLRDAQRLLRDDFRRDRDAFEHKKNLEPQLKKPQTESYWRRIPGELFLLNGTEISTLNVRHVRPVGLLTPEEDDRLLEVFARLRDVIAREIRDEDAGQQH